MEIFRDPSFRPEREVSLPGLSVSIGERQRDHALETIHGPLKIHVASLSLSPLPAVYRGYHIFNGVSGGCTDLGAVMFGPAGASLYCDSSAAPAGSTLYCSFDVKQFEPAASLGDAWDQAVLHECLNIRSARVREMLLCLAREMAAPGFGQQTLIEAFSTALMIALARHLRGLRVPEQPGQAKLAAWQLRRINAYLNEEIGAAPTLPELAELCGISRSHLARLFKATTGTTVHEHVTNTRITRAKAYLSDTSLSLKEIASRLGFSQPAAFAFAFRKSVGTAPRDYRREFRRRKLGN